jgi:hypothetical protein
VEYVIFHLICCLITWLICTTLYYFDYKKKKYIQVSIKEFIIMFFGGLLFGWLGTAFVILIYFMEYPDSKLFSIGNKNE